VHEPGRGPSLSAAQRSSRYRGHNGHRATTGNRSLLTDIVEKVGFRLGLCCWGGFLKHSIAGEVDADATETSLAVSGK
jgi:hypothetical protein